MLVRPVHVYLWELDNPIIIVPAATGVIYCNQVDGVACDQRELEGFDLPLPRIDARIFSPHWWERHHNRRVDGDDAAWGRACGEIERALASVLSPAGRIRELRAIRPAESCEAWVHVAFLFN